MFLGKANIGKANIMMFRNIVIVFLLVSCCDILHGSFSEDQTNRLLNFFQERLQNYQNAEEESGMTVLQSYFYYRSRKELDKGDWYQLNDQESLCVLRQQDPNAQIFKAHRLKIKHNFLQQGTGLPQYCEENNIGVDAKNGHDRLICGRKIQLQDRCYLDSLLHNKVENVWIYTRQIYANKGYMVKRHVDTNDTVVSKNESSF